MPEKPDQQKTPLDIAADLLVFAPVGLAIEAGKHLPNLARQGRSTLDGPLSAARFAKQMAVMQGRRDVGEFFRKVTEPYFGSPQTTGSAGGATTANSPADNTAPPRASTSLTAEDLPITGYDTLPAAQIIEHLGGLTSADLDKIHEYEAANRARKSVLGRIEILRRPE